MYSSGQMTNSILIIGVAFTINDSELQRNLTGLNDSDYDEILNMLEEDFSIVNDADLTDLLDTFDPFSIEDPNLPLPALPPPDTTIDTVTSESSVENPENAPKELSPKLQTSVRKSKCVRKKSIPRKRATTVFEDFFEFPSNAS
ncbi:hypothetical protein ACTXT7_012248, partial [Hymenolepis weldensis]